MLGNKNKAHDPKRLWSSFIKEWRLFFLKVFGKLSQQK